MGRISVVENRLSRHDALIPTPAHFKGLSFDFNDLDVLGRFGRRDSVRQYRENERGDNEMKESTHGSMMRGIATEVQEGDWLMSASHPFRTLAKSRFPSSDPREMATTDELKVRSASSSRL